MVARTTQYSWIIAVSMISLQVYAGTLEYRAQVGAAVVYELSVPAQAILETSMAVPGKKVEQGEVLFTFSSAALLEKKNSLNLEYAKATADYTQAQDWKNTTTMQLSQLRLEQAKIQAEEAQQRLKNSQRLLAAQAITPVEAAREQQQNQQTIQQLRIAELEHTALAAQGTEPKVALLKGQVQHLETQLALVNQQLEQLTLRAPSVGWVGHVSELKKATACARWQPKASCEAHSPVAMFIAEAPWIVDVIVDELDYPKIQDNSEVVVLPVTQMTKSYQATLQWKEPLSIESNTELGHYRVRVALKPGVPLFEGQSVVVRFR